ncbi:MAG TPA: DUF6152 family protein [Steroidobacteraceae bacterium]|jgi:hypothetical protein|nr:DUF6152 family protein [Steroidobacteraceae bacterium]
MTFTGKLQSLFAAAIVALGLSAAPATAHHSFAMFDQKRTLVLEGTVTQFQWTNPHVWIEMQVADPSGNSAKWGVECTSVNILKRQGWHHDSLHPGDRVKLVLRPLRDGSHGGQLAKLLEINGQPADLVSYH